MMKIQNTFLARNVIMWLDSHMKWTQDFHENVFEWLTWPAGMSGLVLHWPMHLLTSSCSRRTSSSSCEQTWKQPSLPESSLIWSRLMWLCMRPSASWEWFFSLCSSSSTFPHSSQSCPSSSTSVTIRLKCSPWSPVRALILRTSWLRSTTSGMIYMLIFLMVISDSNNIFTVIISN